MCQQEDGSDIICKSDEEIKEWLKQKYILTLNNQRRFRLEEFRKGKVVPESRTNWIPINTQYREEVVFKIEITSLELQDLIWQWGNWTKENIDSIFKIAQVGSRPYEFKNRVHVSVTFELLLDQTVIDRQVYSVLDWLGDIGGLVEALFFIGSTVMFLFQFGQFDSMLVTNLYKQNKKPAFN